MIIQLICNRALADIFVVRLSGDPKIEGWGLFPGDTILIDQATSGQNGLLTLLYRGSPKVRQTRSEPIREGTVGTEIDAVIAALKIELHEAEKFDCMYWKAERCNRWIKQLPGAWALQWENLKITGDYADDVNRVFFITHVKASLAYLEAKRTQSETKAARWSWPFRALKRKPDQPGHDTEEPIDAEFTDVPTPSRQRKLPKPKIVK